MKNLQLIVAVVLCYCTLAIGQTSKIVNSYTGSKMSQKFMVRVFSEEGTVSGLGLPFNYYRYVDHEVRKDSSFVLDAQINAHYFIFENDFEQVQEKKNDTIFYSLKSVNTPSWFLVDINPIVDIRIINQFSKPVRSPSYKIGGMLYFLPANKRTNIDLENFYSIQLGYYHHSNGQDGETLLVNAEIPQYAIDQGINEGHDLNVFNGSFGTNFLTLGLNYYKIHIHEDDNHGHNISFGTVIQTNHVASDLEGYFSRYDFYLKYGLLFFKESNEPFIQKAESKRLKFNFRYRAGDNSKLPSHSFWSDISFSAAVYYRLKYFYTSSTALFFKLGYMGSDHYNIYLEDKILYFKMGLATGQFIYD